MADSSPYGGMSQKTGQRVADLIHELYRVSEHRVHASIIPRAWTDDQGKRLSRCINRVLELGEPGLKTIEDVLYG